jgi:hypothetical protein
VLDGLKKTVEAKDAKLGGAGANTAVKGAKK